MQAQDNYSQQMRTAVTNLIRRQLVKDYQQLAADFESIAEWEKTKLASLVLCGILQCKNRMDLPAGW